MTQKIEGCSQFTKLMWADKTALFAACALLSILTFLWSLAFLAIGSAGAKHLWRDLGFQGFELGLLIASSIWIVMRGVDFMIGGSTYRLFLYGAGKICMAQGRLVPSLPNRVDVA